MQSLLKIFPEENGRFVDEPFGVDSLMPNQAQPFYQTFRVVVPTVDDLEKNLARLFAAAPDLPVKKITRYDKDPGAPGLPGFRGIWCQLEDEKQIGFTILTVNQNRFLIWAKMAYFPSLAVDSINQKVRDQYARDVSQYLAGIDMKVPDNEVPQASGRGLPEAMDVYARLNEYQDTRDIANQMALGCTEIKAWGLHGVESFKPTDELLEKICDSVQPRLWPVYGTRFLQYLPQMSQKLAFDSATYAALPSSGLFAFGIDRFGRVRLGDPLNIAQLFDGSSLVGTGFWEFRVTEKNMLGMGLQSTISLANDITTYEALKMSGDFCSSSDEFLESMGLFIRELIRVNSLFVHPLRYNVIEIAKFSP